MSENKPLVLVVLADILQRDLICLALKRHHFAVIATGSGDELEGLLKQNQAALLLLDVYLPHQNGLDLLKQCKKQGLLNQTRVIMLSGFGFPEVVRSVLQAGADDFLVKPLDVDLLIQRMGGNPRISTAAA
jgi:two-component system, response regulator, stage 0 sporulation protein A